MVEVKQGRFVVNSVAKTAEGENFCAWEADCRSKYPDVAGYQGNILWIWPGEGAQHLDESTTEQTQIILPRKFGDWNIMAEGGRYGIRIVAWKNADEFESVYEREQTQTE